MKKFAVRPLVAQLVVAVTIALRASKHHASATSAVAITALMSVVSSPVIVSLWLKLSSSIQLYESLKISIQV